MQSQTIITNITCYSLDSLLHLYKHTLDPKEEFINEAYHTKMLHDISGVAKLLVMPNVCLSASLELVMGHPRDQTNPIPNLPRAMR